MGLIDYYANTERFFLDVIAGLNWAEHRGLSSGVSKGSMGMGVICDVLGLKRLAFSYHRRAAEFAQRAGDASANALSLYGFAFHHFTAGRWDLANDYLVRCTHAFRSLGAIRELGIGIATVIWIAEWRGDVATFVPRIEELRHLAEDAGDRHLGTWALQFTSTKVAREGRLDEAVSMLKQAVESLATIPDYQVLVEAFGRLADCYLRQGRWDKAVASLDDADQWIEKKKIMGQGTVCPRLARAWALLVRAELSDGATRAAAHRETKRACAVAMRTGRNFPAAQTQALCVLGSLAWLSGHAHAAHENWRRSLQIGEQLAATYDIALTYREIGRLAGDTLALNTAAELFRKTGATFDVARTHRYLGELTLQRDGQLAAEWFRCALGALTTMSAQHELALTHKGCGRLYEILGRDEEAKHHLSEATEILERYSF
jgi:tetratricopeptide (TPR) repeat protein